MWIDDDQLILKLTQLIKAWLKIFDPVQNIYQASNMLKHDTPPPV